ATAVDQNLEGTLNKDLKGTLPSKYVDVELTDGALFHCPSFNFKGKNAKLHLPGGEKVTGPLESIAFFLDEAQDPGLLSQWKALIAKKRSSDILVTLDAGELQPIPGTFGEANEDGTRIQFDVKSEGNPKPADVTKIHGYLFLRSLPDNAPPAVCKVYDS